MNRPNKQILLRACSALALVVLSACGGSDDAPAQATQTITFASPGNQAFAATPISLVATATSGLPVSFASTTSTVCTLNNATLTLVGLGTCTVSASQAGNASYLPAAPVSNSFTVAIGAQSITFVSPGNQVRGTTPAALMATSTSGLAVTFASTTPSVCAASGTTLTLLAAGTCTVVASQPGNANYAAATAVPREFEVAVALTAQTITFTSPGSQVMGVAPAPLVATSTSGLAVSFASTTPNVCMVSGTTLSLLTVGTCTVAASQAGNATFAAATAVQNSFSVVAAAQTITFNSPGNQTLGTAPPALVASSTSGLTVLLASTTPGVCMVSGSTLTLVAAGTCTVNASQAGNGTYAAAADVPRSFAVAAAAQTITFVSPGNQTLGITPAPLVASSTSGLTVALASTTAGVCTVSGTTLTLVAVGTCTVNATQAGNATYAAATPLPRSFNVSATPLTPQTITFTSPGTQTLLTAPPALAATSTSGLPVSFTPATPSVCTVSGTTLTLVAVGTCTIDANQAGNGTFAAATTVSNSFPVVAAAQTITFAQPANQTLPTASGPLVATSTSTLPVAFASTTPLVCTVSGTTLTLVAAGTCTINASQVGNATYAAATVVSRSFTVAAAVATINAFANGGFEVAANGAGEFADGWQGNQTVPTRSSAFAHSGTYSALLSVPDDGTMGNGSGMFQNSVDHGLLIPVAAANWGTSPTLTFWIKGNSSETGNFNYALRYLDGIGNILNTAGGASGAKTIWTGNSVRDWTQITRSGSSGALSTLIPVGTTAVFLEVTLATGPTGTFPGCGPTGSFCVWGTAAVYLDDVSLPLLP